jgi:hypothetical protein
MTRQSTVSPRSVHPSLVQNVTATVTASTEAVTNSTAAPTYFEVAVSRDTGVTATVTTNPKADTKSAATPGPVDVTATRDRAAATAAASHQQGTSVPT